MIALLLSALLAQLPSPELDVTRDQVETRWGAPSMAGPPGEDLSWPAGSVMASYVELPTQLDGLCRRHIGTGKGIRWIALVYYAPSERLVSVHCLRLDNLEIGYDVTPDVVARLKSPNA